ncbi:MAG: cytochrome c-type biogenesis protein, partial [Microthrixaceae bacterium]
QCTGESVAGSSAPIAVQFREEISQQMASGSTDDEILNFFSERYGRDILLTPPSTGVGALVWIVPVVALAAAVLLLAATFRRWREERVDRHATDEDQEIVDAAMDARRDAPPT